MYMIDDNYVHDIHTIENDYKRNDTLMCICSIFPYEVHISKSNNCSEQQSGRYNSVINS